MATSTPSRTDLQSPDAHRSPVRNIVRALVIVVVGVLLVGVGSLIGLRLARAGVLPNVTVDGVAVGGLSEERMSGKLQLLAQRKSGAQITAVRDTVTATGQADELGYLMDVEATAEQALYRGRQGNPIAALRDHVLSFTATLAVEPVETVDDELLSDWVTQAATELELAPQEGALRFAGSQVLPVQPEPGAQVDEDDLREQARETVLAGGGGQIDVVTTTVAPETTSEDVDAAAEMGRLAVSAPVVLRRSGSRISLAPDQIGALLETRVNQSDDSSPAIEIFARPQELADTLGEEQIAAFEQEPKSARFDVTGGTVTLVKAKTGFTFNPGTAAAQLVAVATDEDGPRKARLDGDIEEPELTTAQAKDLNVVERVSTFTTYHACCESRVTNIQRFADLVDDTLVMPGETISLNGLVGERTLEKGFVAGGAILDGEFVEQVGGGVSQFATTTYNAAYFGGYQIVEHKAHSYYISRYPEGREATLNYPDVDLKIKNNSPHGMVLNTSYTGTSITVSMFGTKWVEVDTQTGPRHNFREPQTQYRENDELPKGSQRVIQEAGAPGFDVTVTRILRFPDGKTKREEETTTYLAQTRIIERNT